VDRRLRIGSQLQLYVAKRDPRCVVINVDPATSSVEPGVLRHVGQAHGGCVGVYGVVVREGVARAGDPVTLID
jgi:hypothetical protein